MTGKCLELKKIPIRQYRKNYINSSPCLEDTGRYKIYFDDSKKKSSTCRRNVNRHQQITQPSQHEPTVGIHHQRDIPVFGPPFWKLIGIIALDFIFSNFGYMGVLGLAVTVWVVFGATDKPHAFCRSSLLFENIVLYVGLYVLGVMFCARPCFPYWIYIYIYISLPHLSVHIYILVAF